MLNSLKLWRTFREGAINFKRNGWLSLATVSVLSLSLFIVSLSAMLGITTHLILQNLRDRVSVSISFNPDVPEEHILEIKNELAKYKKEIATVDYISRDQALDNFLADSGNDPVIAQAIEEIGENPLLATLVIKANAPDEYPLIVDQIQKSTFQNDISRINYDRNKKLFDRLERINSGTEKVGIILGTLFILMAVLITFNAIRITIYSHRQEFEVMRLVGASNIYVRMPFIFEGVFYGIAAACTTLIALAIVIYYLAPLAQGAIPQGSFFSLFLGSFFTIFGSVLLLGILLGVISSALAIRRYLKV